MRPTSPELRHICNDAPLHRPYRERACYMEGIDHAISSASPLLRTYFPSSGRQSLGILAPIMRYAKIIACHSPACYGAFVISDNAILLARSLIAASYSAPAVPMTERPKLDACAPTLEKVAQRIARNALRAENLTTDNFGMPVLGTDGSQLGTLWSYVGGSKWLSSFFHATGESRVALEALSQWAYENTPPYRWQLLDADVPLLGSNLFGIGMGRVLPAAHCDLPATARRHGYVVSIVETCGLQGRDPEAFIAELLIAGT